MPVHMGVCCVGGLPAGRCRLLCFLFCVCVPLLTVRMLCSSHLCFGFFSALPDAYSALCLVLPCAAPLDVSKSLVPDTSGDGRIPRNCLSCVQVSELDTALEYYNESLWWGNRDYY